MMLLALAEPFPFVWIIYAILIICAIAVLVWFLRKVALPEPLNYVVYAGIAILAILLIAWLVNRFT